MEDTIIHGIYQIRGNKIDTFIKDNTNKFVKINTDILTKQIANEVFINFSYLIIDSDKEVVNVINNKEVVNVINNKEVVNVINNYEKTNLNFRRKKWKNL